MSQRWSLLKCANWAWLITTLICIQPALCAPKELPKPLPKLLREVETKYAQAGTLSADFSQINEDTALTHKKKQSSGRILIKRPSKIRWEVKKPEVSLLVSDGKTYWFYTPPFEEGEKGQVIERKASDVHSKLADALLAGSFSANQFSKIVPQGATSFQLFPKPGTSGTVQVATLEIDPDKKLIQKVTLEHRGGNRSEISLSSIELGVALSDALFTFSPPANTDVIKNTQ